MLVAAYFLGRREVAANFAFAAAACAVALVLWVEPVLRLAMFMAVVAVVGVVTVVVVVLREPVLALVHGRRGLPSHDSLTGALNRGAFEQRLDAELARARRSDIVAAGMRRSDVFGRLGGEEFGLLLPDTGIEGAATVADKLRCRLAAPTAGRRPLTVSFGVAEVRAGASTALAMFDDADRALYAAKRGGRDRVMRSDELVA